MEWLLHPTPPFDLGRTVWAVRRREHNVVDRWDGRSYRRVLVVGTRAAEVCVEQAGGAGEPVLNVAVAGRFGATARHSFTQALERLLGLSVDLRGFYRLAARDELLNPLARRFRGVRPPRFPTVFEALVNGIACQQISLVAGITLLNRLAQAFGREAGGHHAFPTPQELATVAEAELRGLGFSGSKSRALAELARLAATGGAGLADLEALDDAAAAARLERLRGVGRWTAEYVLLRGLGRVNVFPGDDAGARRRLEEWLGCAPLDYAGVRRVTDRWQPWAGLVYFHLLLRNLAEHGVGV